jgi:hypothetical protein
MTRSAPGLRIAAVRGESLPTATATDCAPPARWQTITLSKLKYKITRRRPSRVRAAPAIKLCWCGLTETLRCPIGKFLKKARATGGFMSAIKSGLLLCGLLLAMALTTAWDGFLSYEFLRFCEFVF